MIAISVKTSLKEKLGVLCAVDPSSEMEDVLFKIKEDLGLPRSVEIKSLVRLLPNGKQMHAVIRKPSYLSDVDFYLARCESDDESSDEESVVEQPRYSSPVARRPVKKVTPVSKPKAMKAASPNKKASGKSKRHKAVASVARAAAAANRRATSAARREAAYVPPKPRNTKYQPRKESLTEEQRQQMATVKMNLDEFTNYLTEVEGITRVRFWK